MASNLLIVESPAKAKTLKKYLGADFEVMASYGHVRDLRPKKGAVDPTQNFAMKYEIIEKYAGHLDDILKAIQSCDTLLLATDPDREGEAISWHIYEVAKEKKLLKGKDVHRVVFHEITKTAVQNAVQNPRPLSQDLINAQQARRALDYLVGFNLSPLLWKKIRRGLSAGRVQSPALRMIVEREEEIEKFISQEYWTIEARCAHAKKEFGAKLSILNNEKLKQFDINNEVDAKAATQKLLDDAAGKLLVTSVQKKQRKRNSPAPFTTSTLQQEASRKLGFTTQRTMRTAQQLYEGIDVGQGSIGLITYMRTDSVTLANDAIVEIREFIQRNYGADHLPEAPRVFKTKSKNAQEAHEAIRPTSVSLTPNMIKSYLKPEQFKLYNLIWQRTVACQMNPAIIDGVAVDLTASSGNVFRANGAVTVFPGYLDVYEEGQDDNQDEKETALPAMNEGDKITLKAIVPNQHFTEPPPRYSEATLVKTLEEHGIGRPSTYASIISTLQQREYAELDKKRFKPTDVGRVVNKFLTQFFTTYVDYNFTAKLEDDLDAVSRGEAEWVPLLEHFWQPFKNQVDEIESTVSRKDITQEALDEACPKCTKPLSIRLGKRGRFVGCSGYPECDYTRGLEETASEAPEILEGRTCPKCESPLQVRMGKYGKFIGCTGYPSCKYIEPLEKPKNTEITCPECKKGTLLERKSRFGKPFYACSEYPDCKYAVWNPPMKEACPQCHWPILTLKVTKRRGEEKVCPQKECGFIENISPPAAKEAEE